jgi:hypothetical protein
MKRPSFQFYPGDWLRDTALRTCSLGARGLWIDMICLMHEGSVYGYLKVGNKVILPNNLARMVGATLHEIEGWLAELEDAAVYSKDGEGCIFSRRMIRDEEVRESRAAGGIKGGNPALLDRKERLTSKDNQNPTPSSASSSASASSKEDQILLSPPTTPKADPVPYEAIVKLYHQKLPSNPKVAMLTTKRKSAIGARWRSGTMPDLKTWEEYFDLVSESDFLTGKVQPNGDRKRFVADIDFLINENNIIKIAERKYHGKG